jgi:hypothetical protein
VLPSIRKTTGQKQPTRPFRRCYSFLSNQDPLETRSDNASAIQLVRNLQLSRRNRPVAAGRKVQRCRTGLHGHAENKERRGGERVRCGRPLLAASCAPEGELVWRCCGQARVGGLLREGGMELLQCWSTRMKKVSSGYVPFAEKLLAKQQGGTVD